jgi:small Trp-rich protein
MYLVWLGAALVGLKWFEVKYIAGLSWWWILAPLAVAFVYFEVLEPMFGWDKKKAHTENDKYKANRLKAQLKNKPKR